MAGTLGARLDEDWLAWERSLGELGIPEAAVGVVGLLLLLGGVGFWEVPPPRKRALLFYIRVSV